jgi:hypothetical protein
VGLNDDLKRWVAAGLIQEATAHEIASYESKRTGTSRIGRGTEAVAYLGTTLVLIALVVIAAEFWDRLMPWGRLTLSLVVTLVLLAVGLVLGRAEEPAISRAQIFAWFLAVTSTALAANVAVGELAGADSTDTLFWVSLTALAVSAALWWWRQSVLQMVAMGVASGVTVVALLSLVSGAPDWAFGVSLAALGIAWLLMTWGGLLTPVRTSYVLASVGILAIGFPDPGRLPWPLLGLAACLTLMAASVRLGENVLLGMGVAGLFLYVPVTVFEVFGDSLGVPVALLIAGLVLLGVVIISVRLRSDRT